MKPSEIIQKLGMDDLRGKHKWYVQSTCAVTGDGLTDSMLEMANLVKQYRKENNWNICFSNIFAFSVVNIIIVQKKYHNNMCRFKLHVI